jgi:sugar lactone lactonase YvrE
MATAIGLAIQPHPAHAAPGDITTIAGNGNHSTSGDGGPATAAALYSPYGVVGTSSGLLLSQNGRDAAASRVRQVSGGTITTIAGGVYPPIADGGPATQAALSFPTAVVRTASGDVVIADPGHQRVRKVAAGSGVMTTIAGSSPCSGAVSFCRGATSGDGGPATAAQLNFPTGLAVDAAGNVYVSTVGDYDPTTYAGENRVRRIDAATGVITTVAGGATPADGVGDGGPATAARLDYPRGIALDAHGNLIIADDDAERIRKVDATTGIISTVAGTGVAGLSGDGGPATAAQFYFASGVVTDSAGDLFIADEGNFRVRKVDASGTITTIAGTGTGGFQGGGYAGDGGPATAAQLYFPTGVSVDSAGQVFISDAGNRRVRKIDTTGTITTVAGNGGYTSSGDGGPATAASLAADGPVDVTGNMLLADEIGNSIREVNAVGIISTIAGGGVGDGFPATSASLNGPRGMAMDSAGDLFIADCGDNRVRKIDAVGMTSTVAGPSAASGLGDGGPATSAKLSCPSGVALHNGNLYIADTGDNSIRQVDSSGVITTVAGTGVAGFGGDGGNAASAQLSDPTGVGFDGAGNLYIADTDNNRVRRVDTTGTITTVAGNGASGPGTDGQPAPSQPVTSPTGVAFDPGGALVIAESGYARIRRVDASGLISTVAGNGIPGYAGDGGSATTATLDRPTNLAYDSAGNLLFTDQDNERVRSVAAGTPPPPVLATRKTANCGMVVTKNLTLQDDIGPCPGDGLVISADSVKLNLNGHQLLGDGSRFGNRAGVRIQGHANVTVSNGTVMGFDAGVAIIGGSNNTVTGITSANNRGRPDWFNSTFGDGVVMFFSPGNLIKSNRIIDNGPFDGVGVFGAGSDNNVIQDNLIKGTDNDGHAFAPVGDGILLNPYLGGDRPRSLSVNNNQMIGNRVEGNGNAGISTISDVGGVISDNVVQNNGLENPHGGAAYPGNGIGVQNLFFANPNTNITVDSNRVTGNGRDGIQVLSQSNRITNNVADGNGGRYANRYFFDLRDRHHDPVTYAPSCGTDVWSGNIWGTGGVRPACAAAGGHQLNGASAGGGNGPPLPDPQPDLTPRIPPS